MAIAFETSDPDRLLAAFKNAIDKKHVVTWTYDSDGDFTHTPSQWVYRAWFRPALFHGRLILNLLGRTDETTSSAVYGVYHGRFIESMLAHCDTLFNSGAASAMPTNSDRLTTLAA